MPSNLAEVAALKDKVDEFRTKQQLREPHCISDQVELYIRYLFDTLNHTQIYRRLWFDKDGDGHYEGYEFEARPIATEEQIAKSFEMTLKTYQRLRGDVLLSNSNPRIMAASLGYIGCILGDCNVSQKDIGSILSVSDPSLRKHYTIIKRYLKL